MCRFQFGFFIHIYIVDIFGISIHTLLLFRSRLHSPALVSALPLLSFSLSLLNTHILTQILHALAHVGTLHLLSVYRMRESTTFATHSMRRQARALSLSLVHFERAHILLFRHLRQKQNSQGWWHNISFDSVAISAVSVPLHIFAFAFVLCCFCFAWALRLLRSLVVCSTCDSRFIFCQLQQQRLHAARRASGKVKAGNHMHDLTHTVS